MFIFSRWRNQLRLEFRFYIGLYLASLRKNIKLRYSEKAFACYQHKPVANLFYVNFYTFLLFQTIIIQISVLFIISFRPFIPSLPLQELVLDLNGVEFGLGFASLEQKVAGEHELGRASLAKTSREAQLRKQLLDICWYWYLPCWWEFFLIGCRVTSSDRKDNY